VITQAIKTVAEPRHSLRLEPPERPAPFTGRALRVLIVANSEWYFLSHRLALGKALRRAGCHVTVAAPEERNLGNAIRAAGIGFIPLKLDRGYRSFRRELQSIRQLGGLYRNERPDVVHHVTIKPVIYGSIAARWVGIKCVVNAIAGLGYTFAGKGFLGALRRNVVSLAYRVALAGQRMKVIFQNPEDRDLFVSRNIVAAASTVVIRGSGVNVREFQPPEEPTGIPVVLLASRLLWDKGVGELVEATRILRRTSLQFRTVLVGIPDEQNPRSIPEGVVLRWKEEGIVEWWGHRTDMADVLRTASIVALPSYHEGLPRVLLEAAAAGRSLVATDIPGCREIVRQGHNGLLVPARDPVALANALATLLRDPEMRARMGKAGRSMVVREFSDEQVIDETMQVYSDVLRGDETVGHAARLSPRRH
jgi:glycosyltransferase involved in cell wall biosynthesis